MDTTYNEILKRFPEVKEHLYDGDENLPYLIMNELVTRICDFATWCGEQPRGETAEDDTFTILVLAFYEEIMSNDKTRCLAPKLFQLSDLHANEKYFKSWVGEDNYQKCLQEYSKKI